MSGESLDVQAVVDQFRESEQMLGELRERIRSIVLAEEGADRAADSIETASTRLAAAAAAIEDHLAQMDLARQATVEALEAAQRFLAGTDLNSLRTEVTSSSDQSREGFNSLQAQITELSSSSEQSREGVDSLQAQITELSSRIPQVEQLRAEMETLKQQIPARTRKKMGI
ncbi:hypothetical protein [Gemmatimonas sp.]|uniref:hypothetical protein n=1 Tax=Gemmatimonas sp. TaxID=1962908 RepID=UPI00356B1256